MTTRFAAWTVAFGLLSGTALGQTAPEKNAGSRVVKRRVERHDQQRTLAQRTGGRVVHIDTVVVQGRPQRPQAAVETSLQRIQFPVGTTRYGGSFRRHADRSRSDGW